MKFQDLPEWATRAAKWARDYHDTLRDRPVRPKISPGEVIARLPTTPPEAPEEPQTIFDDFAAIVPDATTHWQHPRFFAYFPANAAPASMLADQLANYMAGQGMLWQTAPAATEIEIVMVDWMRQALGLADHFKGTIQDSASTATLCAILTMRERALDWTGLTEGMAGKAQTRIYASVENHSSIDKAVRISGVGQNNLVKIASDADGHTDLDALRRAISEDRARGLLPAGLVICLGGTSTGAFDNVRALVEVAKLENLYTHVDAAWAGSAMICPEFRDIWDGIDGADSIVMNPHKWLGAQFDCSIQFLADPGEQIRTLGLRPAYLETAGHEDIVNFSEWTIPLGRRFRALKLWFLLRAHGLEDLRNRIRAHVAWTARAEAAIAALPGFRITTPARLALFTFQFRDAATSRRLLEAINEDGRIYLTQTDLDGEYVIRMAIGQFSTTQTDVDFAVQVIEEISKTL